MENNADKVAAEIIAQVGKNIVIGVALGIGKPIQLLNALYRIAASDKSVTLTIITGLTLSRPALKQELEKRFIEPILDRMLQDYEEPSYEKPRKLQQLPENINVIEFFLTPGEYLNNSYVQQHYISTNYSNVVRDAIALSINVYAQLVARSPDDANLYSLSCNADLYHDIAAYFQTCLHTNKKVAIVAEVNENLPFMLGVDALVEVDAFTHILDCPKHRALFSLPQDELSTQDHMLGLYASTLIKDDSCIQIGIGKLKSAITNALIMRQHNNAIYNDNLKQLGVFEKFGDTISAIGATGSFNKGLYASTEMFSDDYMHLYRNGVLKKRVYDHIGLQRLLNLCKITENITADTLDVLISNHVISAQLSATDVEFLTAFGIFKDDIKYDAGNLILGDKSKINADLSEPTLKQKIIHSCLGEKLKTGKVLHAGFFIGTRDFYQELKHLSHTERLQFEMCTIKRTNQLLWNEELAILQRQNARFINFAMMITLGGATVSDGLPDLQEVSGVGGQFDFVNMAHTLPDARSIILCRSVRESKNGLQSNIVWQYSNTTIPRYLRDIVVTEYGIADCRSKTDADVIKVLLNITDSRFQNKLLLMAKQHGKLASNYRIPTQFTNNYPQQITSFIHQGQSHGFFKAYPFGSDLTADEETLSEALMFLKKLTHLQLIGLFLSSLFSRQHTSDNKYFSRMGLNASYSLKNFIYKKIIYGALVRTRKPSLFK